MGGRRVMLPVQVLDPPATTIPPTVATTTMPDHTNDNNNDYDNRPATSTVAARVTVAAASAATTTPSRRCWTIPPTPAPAIKTKQRVGWQRVRNQLLWKQHPGNIKSTVVLNGVPSQTQFMARFSSGHADDGFLLAGYHKWHLCWLATITGIRYQQSPS